MTIYCKLCGVIPLSYVNIDGDNLCLSCSDEQYELKLKKLKEKYAK